MVCLVTDLEGILFWAGSSPRPHPHHAFQRHRPLSLLLAAAAQARPASRSCRAASSSVSTLTERVPSVLDLQQPANRKVCLSLRPVLLSRLHPTCHRSSATSTTVYKVPRRVPEESTVATNRLIEHRRCYTKLVAVGICLKIQLIHNSRKKDSHCIHSPQWCYSYWPGL